MEVCKEKKNTISVCLFDTEEKQLEEIKSNHIFEDKLDKTDIYNKEDEEMYIATSPSFVHDKSSIVDLYDSQVCSQKDEKCTDCTEPYDLSTKTISDAEFSSEVHNTESMEYTALKTPETYQPAISNVDGQSYFVSSDYSQLNNLGIEISKTYFYVLSPMGNTELIQTSEDGSDISNVNAIMRTSGGDTLVQINNDSLIHVNDDSQSLDSDEITPRKNNRSNDDTIKESKQECHVDIAQTEIITTEQRQGHFEHLNNEFNFIHGIPNHSPTKDQSQLIWQQVSSTERRHEKGVENSLLMRYTQDTKMEVPILHGQPYLQVALVNDMDPSATSELVSTDQILGVRIPEIFSCKWESCGAHTLSNSDLVKHVNSAHVNSNSRQHYTCLWKGCVREGKSFDARYKMVIHLRTHTGEKPHGCPVKGCEAAFSRIENLKIHVRSHTGEKPYPCQFDGCDKSFANSSDRFKHKRTHAEKKPYRCPVNGCGKCYTDPSSLRKHKKIQHSANVTTFPV